MRSFLKGVGQIIILCLFSILMNALVAFFHLPIPGSIVGLFTLFFLLHFKIIRLEWIELGATWLLAELLLFFIPAAVGIVQYKELMMSDGLTVLFVIFSSTVLVMTSTGLTAKLLSKRKERHTP